MTPMTPLETLCLDGTMDGKYLLVYDDCAYVRATIVSVRTGDEITFTLSGSCSMYLDPIGRAWDEKAIDVPAYVFTSKTLAFIHEDGVIQFALSDGGDGYIFPPSMDIPSYV